MQSLSVELERKLFTFAKTNPKIILKLIPVEVSLDQTWNDLDWFGQSEWNYGLNQDVHRLTGTPPSQIHENNTNQ